HVGRLHVLRRQRGELGAWLAGLDRQPMLTRRAGRIRGADAQRPVLGAVRNLNELVTGMIGALRRKDPLRVDMGFDLGFAFCAGDPEGKPLTGAGRLFVFDLHAGALVPSWARDALQVAIPAALISALLEFTRVIWAPPAM